MSSLWNRASPLYKWIPLSCRFQQTAQYRAHIPHQFNESAGRTVVVKNGNVADATFNLRSILIESRIKETSKYQERFERPTDKRRRKKKMAKYKQYVQFMKGQVGLAYNLKQRQVDTW
jgi:ribosomal protein S21